MTSVMDDALLDDDIQLKDVEDLDLADEEALLALSDDENDLLKDLDGSQLEYVDEDGNLIHVGKGEKIEIIKEYVSASDTNDQDILEVDADVDGDSFAQEEKDVSAVKKDKGLIESNAEESLQRASENEDEEDEEEEGRRMRFRSERYNIVSLATNKKRAHIPDTLDGVVVEEEVAKANQFLNQEREQKMRRRGNNQRGRGSRPWHRGPLNHPQRNYPQQNKVSDQLWQHVNAHHRKEGMHQFHSAPQFHEDRHQLPLDRPPHNNTGRKILINPHFRGGSFPTIHQNLEQGNHPRNSMEMHQQTVIHPQQSAKQHQPPTQVSSFMDHHNFHRPYVPNMEEHRGNFPPAVLPPTPVAPPPTYATHPQHQPAPHVDNYHHPQPPPPNYHQEEFAQLGGVPRLHDIRPPTNLYQSPVSEGWAHPHNLPPPLLSAPQHIMQMPPPGGNFRAPPPPQQHQQQPYGQHPQPPPPPQHIYQEVPPANFTVPPPNHAQPYHSQHQHQQQPPMFNSPPLVHQFSPHQNAEFGQRYEQPGYHVAGHMQVNEIQHNVSIQRDPHPPQLTSGNNVQYGGQNFGQRRQKRALEGVHNLNVVKHIRTQISVKQQQAVQNSAVHMANIKEIPLVETLPPAEKNILPLEDEDEETRQLRLKIEEQKKLREEVLRRKEERRRQMAAERLKNMHMQNQLAAGEKSAVVATPNTSTISTVQPKPPVKQRLGLEAVRQKKVVVVRKVPAAQQQKPPAKIPQPQQLQIVQTSATQPPFQRLPLQASNIRPIQQQLPNWKAPNQCPRQQRPAARVPGQQPPRPRVPLAQPITVALSPRTVAPQQSVPIRQQHFQPRFPQMIPRNRPMQRNPQMMMRPPCFPRPQQSPLRPRQMLRAPLPNRTAAPARPVLRAAAPPASGRIVIPPADQKGRIIKLPIVSGKTQTVVVKNLSLGTTEKQLGTLCQSVGPIDSIKMEKEDKSATVKFKHSIHASQFQNKFQRFMLDLSMIQVSLLE